jgi:hypothetical protein
MAVGNAHADEINIPAPKSTDEMYMEMVLKTVEECIYVWLEHLPPGVQDRNAVAESLTGKCQSIFDNATQGWKGASPATSHRNVLKIANKVLALRFGASP